MFGLFQINKGKQSVDLDTERAVFQFDLEFASVYSKHQMQFINKTLDSITVEDMIDLFNRVNKAGKYKEKEKVE